MKLTFKEKWMKFWGYGYVANLRPSSLEIHRLDKKHTNCRLEMITDKIYVTRKKALKMIRNDGFNGCRWCWKEKDLG